MKMKNKIASFAALMIIGLLVITGCQGLFEPPVKPGANGTLLVSINDDGRTILPAAKLDSYKLELYTGAGATTTAYTGDYPTELFAGTGIALPGGTYKIVIKGIVGGEVVAQGTKEDVVVPAAGTVRETINLTPEATGNGTFTWDFSEVPELTAGTLEIYSVDGADTTTDLFNGTPEATGSKVLPAGVYNVSFSITAGGETVSWWEILYIYPGLVSSYNETALGMKEVEPPVYDTPAAGNGYFYLNLNNWQTVASGGLEPAPVTGTLAADSLAADFTVNNQFLNIKFSAAQTAILQGANYITITINGSVTADNTFRFFIGTPTTSGNWNATNSGHEGVFSTIAGQPKGTNFDAGKKAMEGRLDYFMLQNRTAADTTLTIKSIRIDYTAGDGIFFLNLSKLDTDGETLIPNTYAVSRDGGAPDSVDFADGVLTATFSKYRQWFNIPLTTGTGSQLASLANAASVDITLFGTGTPSGDQVRVYLGDPDDTGTWNTTSGSGNVGIETLVATDGILKTQTVTGGREADCKYFILQSYPVAANTFDTGTLSLDLTAIRIAYTNKVWVRPPAADADLVIISAANAITISGISITPDPESTTGGLLGNNIEIAFDGGTAGGMTANAVTADSSALPNIPTLMGTNKLGAYDKYTLIVEAYDASDNKLLDTGSPVQFAFVSNTTNFWGNRIGGNFRDITAVTGDVNKALSQLELEANAIAGIYMQPKSNDTVKLVITSFILHKPE